MEKKVEDSGGPSVSLKAYVPLIGCNFALLLSSL